MGTERLPPCPFCVFFLHPQFKQDPKKGDIRNAPRQCLKSRMTKAHLIRIYNFSVPKCHSVESRQAGKRQRSEWRVSRGAAASFRMQDDRWRSSIVRMASLGDSPTHELACSPT